MIGTSYLCSRYTLAILAVTLPLWLIGCGPQQGQLSGTITYRGQPLQSGEILFTGDESRGHNCPGVIVEIENGTFRTPPERGHWGGAYIAYVTAFKGQDTLFANYEMHIDLPQGNTTVELVVPDSAGGAPRK